MIAMLIVFAAWSDQIAQYLQGVLGMDADYIVAVLRIIGINIVLSGDNAIVIALACRTLPPRQRVIGIILGAGAAVILKCQTATTSATSIATTIITKQAARRVPILALLRGNEVIVVAACHADVLRLAIQGTISDYGAPVAEAGALSAVICIKLRCSAAAACAAEVFLVSTEWTASK